jgi:hypothetical protein
MLFKFALPSFAVFAFTAMAQAPATPAANVTIVEEIVAKVNGEIVTRGQLEEKYKAIQEMAAQSGLKGQQLADAIKATRGDALRDEIDALLLVQKAKDMPGLTVDADVTKFFNGLQAQYKFADADKFHVWLQQQFGQTYDELKEQKRRDFLAQKVVGYEVGSRISVPEADMQKYYDTHKAEYVRDEEVFLSQILISLEGKSPDQIATAEAKAAELVARARKGEKFSDLARDNSDDETTNQQGGYLGSPTKRGTMKPELEAKVFTQKKGYVTDPIKLTTPPALLILKVEEHYEAGQASFDEVREDVQNAIVAPLMPPKVREYLTKLRQQAFLQIKENYTDTGAAPGMDTRWHEVAALKPTTTTKEEVLSRAKPHKTLLGVPIPGTTAPVRTAEETEKAPKVSKRHVGDATPEALESGQGPKVPKEDTSAPMAPIKQ